MRFLFTRRWLAFALAVVALALGAWRLGEWQFHRLQDRQERNAIVERNELEAAREVTDVMAVGRPVDRQDEWRIIEATGSYATEDTVIVRYRTREGSAGVDVVVPLELSDGTSVLVDRGWFATANKGTTPTDVPPPPEGDVTITGWVRANATGDSTAVTDQSTRSVNSTQIGEALDRPLLEGFVDLKSESPAPAEELMPVELPELDNGPHFFYGLQWWFFGALAVFGFFYLMYDEWRGGRGPWGRTPRAPQEDPEEDLEGAEHPAVDREHHARQE